MSFTQAIKPLRLRPVSGASKSSPVLRCPPGDGLPPAFPKDLPAVPQSSPHPEVLLCAWPAVFRPCLGTGPDRTAAVLVSASPEQGRRWHQGGEGIFSKVRGLGGETGGPWVATAPNTRALGVPASPRSPLQRTPCLSCPRQPPSLFIALRHLTFPKFSTLWLLSSPKPCGAGPATWFTLGPQHWDWMSPSEHLLVIGRAGSRVHLIPKFTPFDIHPHLSPHPREAGGLAQGHPASSGLGPGLCSSSGLCWLPRGPGHGAAGSSSVLPLSSPWEGSAES